MLESDLREFTEMLGSKEPVPGGGGASALVGSLGMALGSMVGNLTLGKKKYQDVQEEIVLILQKADILQNDLLRLVEEDARGFFPLSQAYGLPSNTDAEKAHKDEVMEKALRVACEVPLGIMEKSLAAVALHEELLTKGTRIAISDVGVGVLFCKAALLGASLNVFINTKLMKDRTYAEGLDCTTRGMIDEGCSRADRVYQEVARDLQRP